MCGIDEQDQGYDRGLVDGEKANESFQSGYVGGWYDGTHEDVFDEEE